MSNDKVGKIEKEIGARIEPHEALTVDALALYGFDISFLKPRNAYKTKTPDIAMAGLEWEIKSPTSSSKTTVRNIMLKGTKQSRHVIIDTIRTNLKDEEVMQELKKYIKQHKSIKKLIVVTKYRKMIVLKGRL
ncbi:MAG: hypothetical protein WBO49_03145 [Candidatus Saccharimonas sp.]